MMDLLSCQVNRTEESVSTGLKRICHNEQQHSDKRARAGGPAQNGPAEEAEEWTKNSDCGESNRSDHGTKGNCPIDWANYNTSLIEV